MNFFNAVFFTLIFGFLSHTTFAQCYSYCSGYYYDKEGNKHEGKFKIVNAGYSLFSGYTTSIKFNPDIKGAKKVRLRVKDMTAFVQGMDSFCLIPNVKYSFSRKPFKEDFCKVLQIGAIDLYEHISKSGDGQFNYTWITYIARKKGSEEFVSFYDRVQQYELLRMIEDEPELHAELKAIRPGKWMEEIPRIVKDYNRKKKYAKIEP